MSETIDKNDNKFQSLEEAIKAEKTADKIVEQVEKIQKLLKEYNEVTNISEALEDEDDYGPGPSILDQYDSFEEFKRSKDYEIRTNRTISEDADLSPYDTVSYDYSPKKWDICWCPILLGDNSKLAKKYVYEGYERRPCVVMHVANHQLFLVDILELTHQSSYLGFKLPSLGVIDKNPERKPSYLKLSAEKGLERTYYRYKWPVWNKKKHRWFTNAEFLDKTEYNKEDANKIVLIDHFYKENCVGKVSSTLWDSITKELDILMSGLETYKKMVKNGFDHFEGH